MCASNSMLALTVRFHGISPVMKTSFSSVASRFELAAFDSSVEDAPSVFIDMRPIDFMISAHLLLGKGPGKGGDKRAQEWIVVEVEEAQDGGSVAAEDAEGAVGVITNGAAGHLADAGAAGSLPAGFTAGLFVKGHILALTTGAAVGAMAAFVTLGAASTALYVPRRHTRARTAAERAMAGG